MSFWEVHAAWRCLQRWRRWAVLTARESSASRRRWLLLCTLRWWRAMTAHYQCRRHQVPAVGGLAVTASVVEKFAGAGHNKVLQQPLQLQQQQPPQLQTQKHSTVSHAASLTPGRLPQQYTGTAAADAAAQFKPDGSNTPSEPGTLQQPAHHRAASPLSALGRLLREHPHLRPPSSAAGTLRQTPQGHVVATCALRGWHAIAQKRVAANCQQEELAAHHSRHTQAGAWVAWRAAFEAREPHAALMRMVYRSRRHGTLNRVSMLTLACCSCMTAAMSSCL
jgi:hypothetical protein